MNGDARDLGMDRPISRRDFLDGVAVGVGALALGGNVTSAAAKSIRKGAYPPAARGLRGSTNAAYAVGHAVRDGAFFTADTKPISTGERYDLVVVGGGISGLTAAYVYMRDVNPAATILIIDNHDDVGGHARRNEFTVNGKLLIGYGGTQAIEAPALYSADAKRLLREVGIDTRKWETTYYDDGFIKRHRLREGAVFFNKESFGRDALVVRNAGERASGYTARMPIAPQARADLAKLLDAPADPYPGLSLDAKRDRLLATTYRDFLLKDMKVHPDCVRVLQQVPHPEFGVGVDAVSALDCWPLGLPGFDAMKLPPKNYPGLSTSPLLQLNEKQDYVYHFPDGNTGIVRALVHTLIPRAMPAGTIEQQLLTPMRYDRFDEGHQPRRIRLGSTCVKVKNTGPADKPTGTEVWYSQGGKLKSVTAGAVVMACWHVMSSRLIEGLQEPQRVAFEDQVKIPLVYANVALTNWRAFKKLGVYDINVPGPEMYWHLATLDYPVSMGRYRFSKSPDQPIIVHVEATPNQPGLLPPTSQFRAGRAKLYSTAFATLEHSLRTLLGRALHGGGFDPARDISGITVNRWGHGYAREYQRPWDTFWPDGPLPAVTARTRVGRIAIANADSGHYAYTNSAIDQAVRAVRELKAVS